MRSEVLYGSNRQKVPSSAKIPENASSSHS